MTSAAWRLGRLLVPALAAARLSAQQPEWGRAPAWFTSFDRPVERLADLVAAAGRNPDSILPLLRGAVRDGPRAATVLDYEESLRRVYHSDSVLLAQRHGYKLRPVAAFVADYQHRLDTTWKVRAALGLGRIAWFYRGPPGSIGARATTILRQLSHTVGPSPALTAVQHALDTLYVRDSLPH